MDDTGCVREWREEKRNRFIVIDGGEGGTLVRIGRTAASSMRLGGRQCSSRVSSMSMMAEMDGVT